jgi:hypothetical protein
VIRPGDHRKDADETGREGAKFHDSPLEIIKHA